MTEQPAVHPTGDVTRDTSTNPSKATDFPPDAEPVALDQPADATAPPWMTHVQYETQHPDRAAYAAELDVRRRDVHRRLHPDRPFVPSREFPCRGTLRLEDRDGPMWTVRCDVCGWAAGVPRGKLDRQYLVSRALGGSRLPDEYQAETFLDAKHGGHEEQTPARNALRAWVEHAGDDPIPFPPLLFGGVGRGKTHLVTLAAATVVRFYLTPTLYVTAADLVSDARESARDEERSAPLLGRALDVPLLVLDDLGAERPTEFAVELLDRLLDHRYRARLPVLVATNLRPADWPHAFGDRATSRLQAMTVPIEVGGPDWRATGRAEGRRGLHMERREQDENVVPFRPRDAG